MKPDTEHPHGFHIDRFWPGTIHSDWDWSPWLHIRRERIFDETSNQNMKQESWQIEIRPVFGSYSRFGRHKFGVRWERTR